MNRNRVESSWFTSNHLSSLAFYLRSIAEIDVLHYKEGLLRWNEFDRSIPHNSSFLKLI